MINTKKVRDRRKLRFESFDDTFRDVESLIAADASNSLRATGNWTLGQTLGHLAFWANTSFDGYPQMPTPPWWLRKLMPLMRGRILNKGMPVGVTLPGVPGGTFGLAVLSTEQGLSRMRSAFERLAAQTPVHASPMFPSMTHEDAIKLNLRHAELHLSFIHPR